MYYKCLKFLSQIVFVLCHAILYLPNIVLYSIGFLNFTPDRYKRVDIKRTIGILRGIFNIKNLCLSSGSYISDILLIFKNHGNLSMSIDVVNSIYSNKIDAHVSRLQTNVVDNYMAIIARDRKSVV